MLLTLYNARGVQIFTSLDEHYRLGIFSIWMIFDGTDLQAVHPVTNHRVAKSITRSSCWTSRACSASSTEWALWRCSQSLCHLYLGFRLVGDLASISVADHLANTRFTNNVVHSTGYGSVGQHLCSWRFTLLQSLPRFGDLRFGLVVDLAIILGEVSSDLAFNRRQG